MTSPNSNPLSGFDALRVQQELFDTERCVQGFIADVAERDPHLYAEAVDLAGFDESPIVRLMRLYDLVHQHPSSVTLGAESGVESRTHSGPHKAAQYVGYTIAAMASYRLLRGMGAGIEPVANDPMAVVGLLGGVLLANIQAVFKKDN